jgi:hypothetical protein
MPSSGEPLDDRLEHGLLQLDGLAEVAVQRLAQPDHVLRQQRLVEAELFGQRRDGVLRRLLAEQHARGVAGHEVDQHEDDEANEEGDGHDEDEPSQDVRSHAALFPGPMRRPQCVAPAEIRDEPPDPGPRRRTSWLVSGNRAEGSDQEGMERALGRITRRSFSHRTRPRPKRAQASRGDPERVVGVAAVCRGLSRVIERTAGAASGAAPAPAAYERYVWVNTMIVVGRITKFCTLFVVICVATP